MDYFVSREDENLAQFRLLMALGNFRAAHDLAVREADSYARQHNAHRAGAWRSNAYAARAKMESHCAHVVRKFVPRVPARAGG